MFEPFPTGQTRDMPTSDSSQRGRQLTVDADVANLARVRNYVASVARESGASDHIVEQLELAVSELATNAIQYDPAETLTVVMRCDGTSWTVDVSSADGLVDIDASTQPDPEQLSGRGLFLVDAMMDRLELVKINGRNHIRCVKFAD